MPSISIYVNDKVYAYLTKIGPSASIAGKDIIESDYNMNEDAGGE